MVLGFAGLAGLIMAAALVQIGERFAAALVSVVPATWFALGYDLGFLAFRRWAGRLFAQPCSRKQPHDGPCNGLPCPSTGEAGL